MPPREERDIGYRGDPPTWLLPSPILSTCSSRDGSAVGASARAATAAPSSVLRFFESGAPFSSIDTLPGFQGAYRYSSPPMPGAGDIGPWPWRCLLVAATTPAASCAGQQQPANSSTAAQQHRLCTGGAGSRQQAAGSTHRRSADRYCTTVLSTVSSTSRNSLL
jgi:hypothetical protein